MNWDEPLPSVCAEDGKGGCKKHPPTIRLTQFQYWLLDEDCPGRRVLWPALQYEPSTAAPHHSVQSAAEAYYYLIDPKYSYRFKNRILKRVQEAETLRAKEMKR
jgi:hypothetical protein